MQPTNGHHLHDHERTDIGVKGIAQFLMGLLLGGVVIYFLLGALWRYLSSEVPDQPVTTAFTGPRELPPGPRLQVAPQTDLAAYLESERKQLTSYGWVDQPQGAVRIPIDKAIDLVLQRGLPTRGTPTSTPAPRPNAAKTR